MLKHFFTKPKLSNREARWLETLGNFGVFQINLKPGKIHVLGDALSRLAHITRSNDITFAVINSLECERDEIVSGYNEDSMEFCRKKRKEKYECKIL